MIRLLNGLSVLADMARPGRIDGHVPDVNPALLKQFKEGSA